MATDYHGEHVPDKYDGVDLSDGDECPICEHTGKYEQNPAGYFTCMGCFSTWAGDPTNASIVEYYPHQP